jgi:hypothetical protein
VALPVIAAQSAAEYNFAPLGAGRVRSELRFQSFVRVSVVDSF